MINPVFLKRVVLNNYKSIKGCSVCLGPLTFLVGQNGAGKSNFLDALRLVTEFLNTSLKRKVICMAVVILLGLFLIFNHASAEVFKWVDDKGTVHFTEDESAIPEKYREQAEKTSPPEDAGSPKGKVEADKPKGKESTKPSAKKPVEKERPNVRRIESDVRDSFDHVLSLWKDRKYNALYDCGDRKSRTLIVKEDFSKQMEQKSWELALSWEKVRDIEVEVKSPILAYVTARIGYRPKQAGDTRIRTETFEMRLESGIWRVNLVKLLRAPAK